MNYRKISLSLVTLLSFLTFSIYGQGDLFISGNSGPIANAGRDIKTLSKGSIFLDGSKSYVSDGSTIKYHWEFSPGLVLNRDNDFSQEIAIESFGKTYLKSVTTFNDVLDVKLAENDPGTKLEVILTVKDRIGFEDKDTLIVEYFDPTVPSEEPVDTLIIPSDSIALVVEEIDTTDIENSGAGILIQSYAKDEVPQVDIEIINSIIFNQIQDVGYREEIFLNKDLLQSQLIEEFSLSCRDDECGAKNANYLNAKHVLAWEFSESEDLLYIRIFDPLNYSNSITSDILSDPYKILSESGIYGLDPLIRVSVKKMMSAKNFKNEISAFNRFKMKNEVLMAWGKYPLWAGITYLILDKVFASDSKETLPTMPPGFPHEQ